MSEAICDNTSVGVILHNDRGEILMIERRKFPPGFAPPAGHIDNAPSAEKAAENELFEETGMGSAGLKCVLTERVENRCRREGGDHHHWQVFEGVADPSRRINRSTGETRQVFWASRKRIQTLAARTQAYLAGAIADEAWRTDPGLEPVWYGFFKQLGIIAEEQ